MEILNWKTIEKIQLNPSVTRQMFFGEKLMVTHFSLDPGTALPTHEHESEQITMVQEGSVTLIFPDEEVTLHAGDMLVIPASKPHGAVVGPDGCKAIDLFSPIRKDFIEGAATVFEQPEHDEKEPYRRLYGFLRAAGIKATLEEMFDVPLDILARYAYDRECITMGQLRQILGLDKAQAKDLLRQWKHGDDHSESSYKRKLERLVIVPEGLPLSTKSEKEK
jgi:quercetin dioxygenase-like cupin family protein